HNLMMRINLSINAKKQREPMVKLNRRFPPQESIPENVSAIIECELRKAAQFAFGIATLFKIDGRKCYRWRKDRKEQDRRTEAQADFPNRFVDHRIPFASAATISRDSLAGSQRLQREV